MSTSSFEHRICAMFDSFCKTVSRNYVRNLERAERNRQKHIMDAPVSFFLELLGHEDHHPSDAFTFCINEQAYEDAFTFCINEQAYEIADEHVYHALLGLPKKQRTIIILSFWEELSDRQIAEKMEVTPRTVYNLKCRAFSSIREFYEKRGRDP